MNLSDKSIRRAIKTIEIEMEAISSMKDKIGASFSQAVILMASCTGRIVITGIGKSAAIANKIVATLNSTGTPSIFMHAADAVHGDLGNIQEDDIVICLSKSGETAEIKVLIPFIEKMGNKVIAITGNTTSFLAKNADVVLDTTVEQEACPNNLAPTASTTAQLVMGDALAVALLEYKGFNAEDFARYHPGGALGKQLYLHVRDLINNNANPAVDPDAQLKDIVISMSSGRLGATVVVKNDTISGIITDGDLRRMLESNENWQDINAADIMHSNPKTMDIDAMAVDAYRIMKENKITQLPVTENAVYCGMIHIHDILREGIY